MKNLLQKINVFIIVFGGLWLLWYYQIDGVYVNKPLTFQYDIQNIQTVKDTYSVGEMVQGYARFCKNRQAEHNVKWSLHNGFIVWYTAGEPLGTPTGCYGQDEPVVFNIREIPKDTHTGKVHFEGVGTVDIGGGRTVENHYKTQDFYIK